MTDLRNNPGTSRRITCAGPAAPGGSRQRELAAEFGVSQPVISAVVNRRRWAHVEGGAA